MFVVSVCSLKGGVGKTSVVLGLAAAARARGLTTLVVDLDPQGDATYALGVDAPGAVSADVLERPKRKVLERAIVPAGWPRGNADLHVLPSSDATANLDRPDADGEQLHTLRTALGKLDYDLVLIDAPPSLSGLTRSALVASDRAVVVTEAGAFAVNAVTRLFAAIDEIRRTEAGGLRPRPAPKGESTRPTRDGRRRHDVDRRAHPPPPVGDDGRGRDLPSRASRRRRCVVPPRFRGRHAG